MEPGSNPPTNYGATVTKQLARMTRQKGAIDQAKLRHCLGLSSSYLVTDASMSPEDGINTWYAGFNRLVEVCVALHARGELELETVNVASRACSECWSVACTWREFDESREGVRAVATKLKKLLDENKRTYRGEKVYVP